LIATIFTPNDNGRNERAESMRIEAEGSAKSIDIKAKANKATIDMLN